MEEAAQNLSAEYADQDTSDPPHSLVGFWIVSSYNSTQDKHILKML